MNRSDYVILMTADRIRRTVQRIAHEVSELNAADHPVVLFGINQRGFTLATMLKELLSGLLDTSVTADQLAADEGLFNGDNYASVADGANSPFIIVVDDVIFSGQTMFKALRTVISALDPAEVYTAVLVDRGHRKIPVRAEFCGMRLPTKLDEHVSVLTEDNKIKEVVLTHH
ncbi:MAG TPA: phosphoribosyltransferase family protein [Fodinibius sp.]|nr:phosphoribosyltransferase family protein [Fodinibius sp.]